MVFNSISAKRFSTNFSITQQLKGEKPIAEQKAINSGGVWENWNFN
jgi:hypothetical protein